MWIIKEPNMLELWNKLHFEEEKKGRVYTMLKIFGTYICWKNGGISWPAEDLLASQQGRYAYGVGWLVCYLLRAWDFEGQRVRLQSQKLTSVDKKTECFCWRCVERSIQGGPRKAVRLPFCTCPCDNLSGSLSILRRVFEHALGSYDRTSWAKYEERRIKRCNN